MSQSYREDCLERKRVREGITESRQVNKQPKKDRPVVLQYRWREGSMIATTFPASTKWTKHRSYATEKIANAVMAKLAEKNPDNEYRIKPEDDHGVV